MISFTVPGAPVPKGRPRFKRMGRITATYTPAATRRAETTVARYARIACAAPLNGPVRLEIQFYVPIPQRFTLKMRAAAEAGLLLPVTKPDTSNLVKTVEDAINGIVYADDNQVAVLVARKQYSINPRTEVHAWSL